jgi:hypothetical protein
MKSFINCTLHQKLLRQIKDDEMDDTCNMHGRDEKCIQNFGQKNLVDNIKLDLGEMGHQGVYWVQLAQNRIWQQALVNTGTNL